MNRLLALVLAMALAAGFAGPAQALHTGEPCEGEQASGAEACCASGATASECTLVCASASVVAIPGVLKARLPEIVSGSAAGPIPALLGPLARAPDTAPPKPVV